MNNVPAVILHESQWALAGLTRVVWEALTGNSHGLGMPGVPG